MIYLYGITESEINSFEGLESNIFAVAFNDIFAVVEKVSQKFSQEHIDKNIKDINWLVEKGSVHEKVVEKIMDKQTIIPVPFCTIFETEKKLDEMLEDKYLVFKENLDRLRNKVEVGVKVYYNPEELQKKIIEETDELKKKASVSSKMLSGKAYFEERKVEDKSKELMEAKLYNNARKIFQEVKNISMDAVTKEVIKKKITGKNMLLNSVFLIDKTEKERFREDLNKVQKKYNDLEFQLIGPFPPYNFVNR